MVVDASGDRARAAVTDVRRIRGRPIPATPPWRVIGWVACIGVVVGVLAVVVDSSLMLGLGAALIVAAGFGFLVPAFRDRRDPQRTDRESYFAFVVGLFRRSPSAGPGAAPSEGDNSRLAPEQHPEKRDRRSAEH
jgi:hypothetical protein